MRSFLACAHIDAIDRHKASFEYIKDMNEYGKKTMPTSIALTKEWVATEHPCISPYSYD